MKPRRLPPLSSLRAFEAAARHQSAKLAAEELSVTPTAISHQVRQLEEWLGLDLFLRKPRRLVLTAQGRELQACLSTAFDELQDLVERLKAAPPRRAVTLSTTPAVAVRRLLPWVCLLRDSHPDIDLRVHASHEPVTLDGITADMAIRYGSGDWPGLSACKLMDTTFVPVCSPALKLTRAADLPRHPLIHFQPQNAQSQPVDWTAWQNRAKVPGLDVTAGLVFFDETHVITATMGGQGVALMGKQLIADELEAGRLVQPFGPELKGMPFHLVYPEGRRNDPAIVAVRDWVLGLMAGDCPPA